MQSPIKRIALCPSQKMASGSFDKLTKARKSPRLLCSYCYRVETPLLHRLAGLFCCFARGARRGQAAQCDVTCPCQKRAAATPLDMLLTLLTRGFYQTKE